MQLSEITTLVREELLAVNKCIEAEFSSPITLISQLSEHIIYSGGKRLRPQLLLLVGKALGGCNHHHIQLAAVIEFIHTATLLHDDVVDTSALRRGHPTANALWGNEASVLVGDFLYSRSFQMMIKVGSMTVMRVLAETTNIIAQGEVLQLSYIKNPELTEQQYCEVIHCKTAILFAAAAEISAIAAGCDDTMQQQLHAYGKHLGMAFQITDDLIDYNSNSQVMGKNSGDDLANGKLTLPLIKALQRCNANQAALVKQAIRSADRSKIAEIQAILLATEAIQATYQAAQHEADLALQALATIPDNSYRQALVALTHFAVDRAH